VAVPFQSRHEDAEKTRIFFLSPPISLFGWFFFTFIFARLSRVLRYPAPGNDFYSFSSHLSSLSAELPPKLAPFPYPASVFPVLTLTRHLFLSAQSSFLCCLLGIDEGSSAFLERPRAAYPGRGGYFLKDLFLYFPWFFPSLSRREIHFAVFCGYPLSSASVKELPPMPPYRFLPLRDFYPLSFCAILLYPAPPFYKSFNDRASGHPSNRN